MKVSDFEDFSDFETDALLTGSKQRNWLWFGLLVSLGLHLALCAYFYRTHFQPANVLLLEGRQVPTFKVKNVDLDAKALDKSSFDQANAAAKPEPDQTNAQPDEKKSFDKLLQEVQA